MPIQEQHKHDLRFALHVHNRLMSLAESSNDRELYELLIRIGSDSKTFAILDELTDHPENVYKAAEDIRRFSDERGVYIPPEMDVVFKINTGDSWFIGFQSSAGGLFGYEGGSKGRGWVCGAKAKSDDGDDNGDKPE